MFGDGVFGSSGAVWCCTLVITLPAIYAFLFAAVMRISLSFALRVAVLGNVVLVYLGAGYLFGDAIGMISAVTTMIMSAPIFLAQTQRRVITFGQQKAKNVFHDNISGGTFIYGDDAAPDDDHIIDV